MNAPYKIEGAKKLPLRSLKMSYAEALEKDVETVSIIEAFTKNSVLTLEERACWRVGFENGKNVVWVHYSQSWRLRSPDSLSRWEALAGGATTNDAYYASLGSSVAKS